MKKLTAPIFLILLGLFHSGFGQTQDSVQTLTLQECIEIAIENNLSVRRSQLLQEGAQIILNQSRAGQLPTLNASGSYGYNFGRSIDPVSNQFIAQEIQFTSVGGSSNVTLFNWFRLTNTVRQNRLSYESTEYDVEKAKNDISLSIATFYLNVILNRELLQNAEYQLLSSNTQLDRTKILVANGSLARSSELDLISQVATNEVNLVTAQNNLNLAMLSLKQAMLIPASQEFDIVIPEIDLSGGSDELPVIEEVYSVALLNMPEIKSAELQLQSAQIGVKVAEASYTPTISLNGSLNTNYSNIADQASPIIDGTVTSVQEIGYVGTLDGQPVVREVQSPNIVGEDPSFGYREQFKANLSKSVSLGVTVPIFNNLRTSSSVQRSKISLQQAEITLIEQKNQLRQTIESSYNDAQAAAKTYQASVKQVDALTETFRSMENQYNLGAANFTEYQVASNNLFRAKSDLVRAKYDYVFKKKILDFYQGITPTF